MKRTSSFKPVNPSSRDTSSKNKVFIILGIALLALVVLGSLLFFSDRFVGKAISGQDYNMVSLTAGSAGIPIFSNATAKVGENNYFTVYANLGSDDGLVYKFSFSYQNLSLKLNDIMQGVTTPDGVVLPMAVLDVNIVSLPLNVNMVTVTGAVIPNKTLKDYAINVNSPLSTIVPLVTLNMTPLSNSWPGLINFTEFTVLNESNANLINTLINATFDIIIAPVTEICNNTVDDNNDSLIDCADPTCDGVVHHRSQYRNYTCEFSTELNCKDSFDNDGDDPNLTNNIDEMYDCLDSDCDKKEHYHDQICNYGSEGDCADNQFDNDFDGLTNCEDRDCYDKVCTQEGTSYCENKGADPHHSTRCTLDANHNNIYDYDEGLFCVKGDGGFSNSQGEYNKSWIMGINVLDGIRYSSADGPKDTCVNLTHLTYYKCFDAENFTSEIRDCVLTESICNSTYGFCQKCTPQCSEKGTGFVYQCGSNGCGGTCGVCPTGQTCVDGACVAQQSSLLGDKDNNLCLTLGEYNDFKTEWKGNVGGIQSTVTSLKYNDFKIEYKTGRITKCRGGV